MSEKQFAEDVEHFFNEEDYQMGIQAVDKIDDEIVDEFKDAFEGIEIISYDTNELEFKVDNSTYQVAFSTSYERWRVYRLIKL